jgi:hypothetical protein
MADGKAVDSSGVPSWLNSDGVNDDGVMVDGVNDDDDDERDE